MLPLLISVTVIFYVLGIAIEKTRQVSPDKSKRLLVSGVALSLCVLLYFKYLNFLIDGLSTLLSVVGLKPNHPTLDLLMPIGVSFFTFKLISYVAEVYKGSMKATKDFVSFATYVAFFPTIMSGPIDRPYNLIPQLSQTRLWRTDMVSEGLKRILWGCFSKMCVADVLASYSDAVFNNLPEHSAISIALASVLYSFQIYADFSGYSHMAIGVALIMGLRVMENFKSPYL